MKRASKNAWFPVPGFKFSGISSGIKKNNEKDLALIFSDVPAVTSGVFTTNKVKAAPVSLAIEKIASHKGQAILINSGNANACTGLQGTRDAREMTLKTAGMLGISPELVYVSSTGIIGRLLPVGKIRQALPGLIKGLSPVGLELAASAIMTTDKFQKCASRKIRIGAKTGTITAIAKGAGMIYPDMATMLCYIVTDISLTPAALNTSLMEAVNKSFNMLSVDNDMSTNDTVMIMANGVLGNKSVSIKSSYYQKFRDVLADITYELARLIAEDGEGATKLIEIIVEGAKTDHDARKVARAVSQSMLVKTALYGRDPNWGRLMAAIGYSKAYINEQKTDIFINRIKLVSNGRGTNKESSVLKSLANKNIVVTINLGTGSKSAKAVTCDLTEEYININAQYST
jgi:glutamate N-acetyltransferase/amino-acid N-acetyltransferase